MSAERLSFDDLFDARGTAAMRLGELAGRLDGQPAEIAGVLVATHGDAQRLLLADGDGCPDCAPVPVAAIFLPDLRAVPAGIVPGRTPVVARGRLRVGFHVDADQYASFVRLEDATIRTGG